MNWKYLKIGSLLLLALLVIVPSILYLLAFDWSKKHTARIDALPYYDETVDQGEYRLQANNLEFHIRVAGMQNEGPGLILLHGFPESSLMWQPLLEQGAQAGYRVLAFDQRGYSPSARPSKVAAYQIDLLVQDVLAVSSQVGFDTFHLVGHDWGAGVGWKCVMDYPERIHTWTALSIPHSGVFFEALQNHPEQQKRSAYMKRMQLPLLPEFLAILNQKKIVAGLKDRWTPEQIKEFLAIHREYGALTSALNWYRANNIETSDIDAFKKKILRPTLFIWGKQDPVVAPAIIPLQRAYMEAPYQELSVNCGHSIIQAKTDSVLQAIFTHLTI